MKQKIIFTLMAFVMTAFGISTEAMAAEKLKQWVKVRTAAEFVSAVRRNVNIKLCADIDLTNTTLTTYGISTIDFKGNEITGLKDSYDPATEAPYYALKNINNTFLENVSNLNIHNIVIDNASEQIFGDIKNSKFQEIIVQNCALSESPAIIGDYCTDTDFTDMVFLGNRVYCDKDTDSGSLMVRAAKGGTMKNLFASSANAVYVHGDESYGARVGSFVGLARTVKIKDCTSFAIVMGYGDHCGGIAGIASDNSVFTNCHFFGMVKHVDLNDNEAGFTQAFITLISNKDIAGIYDLYGKASLPLTILSEAALTTAAAANVVDFAAGIQLIKDCGLVNKIITATASTFIKDASVLFWSCAVLNYAYFAYTVYTTVYDLYCWFEASSAPDRVGGIVGSAEDSSFDACSNYGMVYSLDANGGGIVGRGDNTTITNCLNHGAVHGGQKTGGIAGEMQGGSISTSFNVGSVTCKVGKDPGHIIGACNCELSYNCFSDTISDFGTDETKNLQVSQKDIVSGRVAVFLNEKSGTDLWHQTIGEDYWPNLVSTHQAVKESDIDDSQSTVIQVYDKHSLTSAMVNPYSDISLMNDIEYDGGITFNLSSEYMPFCGSIEGNGHSISNVYFEQTGKTYTFAGLESWWRYIDYVGMLSVAKHATFRNLTLNNFCLELSTNVSYAGLLVGKSNDCIYENIGITGESTIYESSDDPRVACVGGLVGKSADDKFTNCWTGQYCEFKNNASTPINGYSNLGGLAGESYRSTFESCYNRASLEGIDGDVGGIAGYTRGGMLHNCLNTGNITALYKVGGITGELDESANCSHCVNTGTIKLKYFGTTDGNQHAAGIASRTKDAIVNHCLNFGSITMHEKANGYYALYSICYTADKNTEINSCYCHCYLDNVGLVDNLEDNGFSYEDILSGKFAYVHNEACHNGTFYQDVDDEDFFTELPVPIPDAGIVNRNVQCDGTITYSNEFASEGAHEATDISRYGICTTCGKTGKAPNYFYIREPKHLNMLSYAVRKGVDFSETSISMENDIDMQDVDNFMPIGDTENAFSGTFNARGHRIKNLKFKNIGYNLGIFGCVSGKVDIQGLIADSTCSYRHPDVIRVGGIVGSVYTPEGASPTELKITNCGNEASILGKSEVGGLVAGVSTSYTAKVDIINSYNTGAIKGEKKTAAIIGDGSIHTYINNVWNTGSVTGAVQGYPFANISDNRKDDYDCTLSNCYGINTQTGVETITDDDLRLGVFTRVLNSNLTRTDQLSWAQSIDSELLPHFGDTGVSYSRNVSSQWGTVVLPYTVTSTDKLKFYVIKDLDEDNVLHLSEVESVEPNTPCFFKVPSGTTNICIKDENEDASLPTSGLLSTTTSSLGPLSLIGTYEADSVALSPFIVNYYIARDKVWSGAETFYVSPFHAYMLLAQTHPYLRAASVITIADPDDETTSIGEISSEDGVNLYDGPVYNLAGQQIQQPANGRINVVRGRKFIRK